MTSANNPSVFLSVACSTDGAVYAVGIIFGSDTFNFGNGVIATAAYSSGYNLIIVKYSSSGTTQWARTVTSAGI
jgi:hypothetical protein